MKTVCIIRHAKSSREDAELADIDRPLAPRGIRDAPVMGERLRAMDVRFDVVYSSPATRAKSTAELLAEGMRDSAERITIVELLYGGDDTDILEFLASRSDALDSVALVLHNPEATALSNRIGDMPVDDMPTCGVYIVRIDTDRWVDVPTNRGETVAYEFPKKHA